MPAQKNISSLQNSLVKKVLALKEKSRERRKTGLFVIEGQRELDLALQGGYTIETVLLCPEIASNIEFQIPDREHIEISRPIYEKLAHRGSTEGVLAIAKAKNHDLASVMLPDNPLILVAQRPEKPGNIGALLRTADAANLDAVFIADTVGDVYNPNIIRSSVGCVFTTTVGIGSSEEIIRLLKNKSINIYTAALNASKPYTSIDFTTASAIVVGTESTGLTDTWLSNADQNIIIPMQGVIDSMNVSVSAAILIFEAKRQRSL